MPAASMISIPTKQQRRGAQLRTSVVVDRPAAATMTPASNVPCSDHSYELPLRRNLLLLLDLLDILRFVAAVLLDRLGVASCDGGGVQLPGQTWWGDGERADDDDDAAVERFVEAMLWAPRSPVTSTTTRTSRTAARYRRRRRADDSEGAAVCAICLMGLGAGGCEAVGELGVCSHAFHAACIDAWAGTGEAATCPLCRAPMSSLPTAWDDDRRRQSS